MGLLDAPDEPHVYLQANPLADAVVEGKFSVAALPTDSAARKRIPVTTGVLDYFPDAIAAVAEVSRIGNDKHNPGQPLHWSRHKSDDHADCIGRHLLERGQMDPITKVRHSAQLAWRALAMLQLEIEADRK
jgi:hypothetical protein